MLPFTFTAMQPEISPPLAVHPLVAAEAPQESVMGLLAERALAEIERRNQIAEAARVRRQGFKWLADCEAAESAGRRTMRLRRLKLIEQEQAVRGPTGRELLRGLNEEVAAYQARVPVRRRSIVELRRELDFKPSNR